MTEAEITKKIEAEANKEIDILNQEIEKVKKDLAKLQIEHDTIKLNEVTSQ